MCDAEVGGSSKPIPRRLSHSASLISDDASLDPLRDRERTRVFRDFLLRTAFTNDPRADPDDPVPSTPIKAVADGFGMLDM